MKRILLLIAACASLCPPPTLLPALASQLLGPLAEPRTAVAVLLSEPRKNSSVAAFQLSSGNSRLSFLAVEFSVVRGRVSVVAFAQHHALVSLQSFFNVREFRPAADCAFPRAQAGELLGAALREALAALAAERPREAAGGKRLRRLAEAEEEVVEQQREVQLDDSDYLAPRRPAEGEEEFASTTVELDADDAEVSPLAEEFAARLSQPQSSVQSLFAAQDSSGAFSADLNSAGKIRSQSSAPAKITATAPRPPAEKKPKKILLGSAPDEAGPDPLPAKPPRPAAKAPAGPEARPPGLLDGSFSSVDKMFGKPAGEKKKDEPPRVSLSLSSWPSAQKPPKEALPAGREVPGPKETPAVSKEVPPTRKEAAAPAKDAVAAVKDTTTAASKDGAAPAKEAPAVNKEAAAVGKDPSSPAKEVQAGGKEAAPAAKRPVLLGAAGPAGGANATSSVNAVLPAPGALNLYRFFNTFTAELFKSFKGLPSALDKKAKPAAPRKPSARAEPGEKAARALSEVVERDVSVKLFGRPRRRFRLRERNLIEIRPAGFDLAAFSDAF